MFETVGPATAEAGITATVLARCRGGLIGAVALTGGVTGIAWWSMGSRTALGSGRVLLTGISTTGRGWLIGIAATGTALGSGRGLLTGISTTGRGWLTGIAATGSVVSFTESMEGGMRVARGMSTAGSDAGALVTGVGTSAGVTTGVVGAGTGAAMTERDGIGVGADGITGAIGAAASGIVVSGTGWATVTTAVGTADGAGCDAVRKGFSSG